MQWRRINNVFGKASSSSRVREDLTEVTFEQRPEREEEMPQTPEGRTFRAQGWRWRVLVCAGNVEGPHGAAERAREKTWAVGPHREWCLHPGLC